MKNLKQCFKTEIFILQSFLCPLFLIFMVISCSTSQKLTVNKIRYVMEVDSYGNESLSTAQKYIIKSGDTTVNENDLQYIEFSEYIKKTLNAKGLIEVSKLEDANLVVFFKYGISDPKTFQTSLSIPSWGQTGISSSNTTGNIKSAPYSNNITYNQTTTSTPTYGITGSTNMPLLITHYLRYITLTVFDFNEYKESGKEKIVWKTVITSSGGNDDLRRVIPYLIVAGQDYFGKSSGERKEIEIYEGDQRINQLKGILVP